MVALAAIKAIDADNVFLFVGIGLYLFRVGSGVISLVYPLKDLVLPAKLSVAWQWLDSAGHYTF